MIFFHFFFVLLHLLLFIYSPLVWEDEDASEREKSLFLDLLYHLLVNHFTYTDLKAC